jgi:hypothetical protein
MYQSSFFPLRSIVGDAVPIGKVSNIRKVFETDDSRKLDIEYDFSVKPSILDTRTDPHYAAYLPVFQIDGQTITPGEGMDTLPLPPGPRPFNSNDPVISFFALAKRTAAADVSRKLAVRFTILLPERFLVGGICFGGFPYLPYARPDIVRLGENSSNFGLPREVRLTCLGERTGDETGTDPAFDYLDSEISATEQEIVSDSGLHYLCIDPTLTNALQVQFSDYATILSKVKFDSDSKKYQETQHYGFIVPYFYVFQYKEKTRYRPIVSAGLLGTAADARPAEKETARFSDPIDHRHVVTFADGANYFDFTAASMFGQQREFVVRDEWFNGKKPKGKVKDELRECFISLPVKPQESVVLHIEQAEEYERCIAGLKLFLPFVPKSSLKKDLLRITEAIREFYPNAPDLADLADSVPRTDLENFLRAYLKIPEGIDFCEKIGIKVYELDPLEGVSPLRVPLDSEYATLLCETQIDELSEIALALLLSGIKFIRPSNSRFFALELTNLDDEPGQFVIKSTKLIQSAHVSVHARAARTQQIRTLNFRIIGPDLAEDYSFLGGEGFNFSIERFVAGERKTVLYQANSLLDLLHTGSAKIFSNIRRRAVEEEQTVLRGGQADNYEVRYSEMRGEGWRRSEAGQGVSGRTRWTGNHAPGAFDNFSSAEIRTHNQLLSPQESNNDWKAAAFIGNAMYSVYFLNETAKKGLTKTAFLGPDQRLVPTTNDIVLFKNFSNVWRGVVNAGETDTGARTHKNSLKIEGVKSVTASPFGVNSLGKRFFDFMDVLSGKNPSDVVDTAGDLAAILGLGYLTQGKVFGLSAANSLSVGLSVQPVGLGVTLSASTSGGLIMPSYTLVNSFGTQGSITRQANKTGYAYSQFLNNSFDETNSRSEIADSRSRRVIKRSAVEGTDGRRVKGAEVMWQGQLADIITGSIPLNFTLAPTAGKMYFRTADDSLRVRFGSGVGKSISVDFWFDVAEEMLKDDS